MCFKILAAQAQVVIGNYFRLMCKQLQSEALEVCIVRLLRQIVGFLEYQITLLSTQAICCVNAQPS